MSSILSMLGWRRARAGRRPGDRAGKVAVEADPIRRAVAAGGASDVTARVLGQKLQEAFGQPVVIENRVAQWNNRARTGGQVPGRRLHHPDGESGPNAINPVLYEKLPYDAIKDFAPITLTTMVPLILTVNPEVEAKTVKELLAYAKAHPGS